MNKHRIAAATLTINKDLTNGQTISFAKIELSYKRGSPPLQDQDVARAHCDRLFKQIVYSKGIFKQQTGGSLSLDKKSGLHGDIYFSEEHFPKFDSLPEAIGELWCDVITKGMGSYSKVDVELLPSIPLEIRMRNARDDAISAANR